MLELIQNWLDVEKPTDKPTDIGRIFQFINTITDGFVLRMVGRMEDGRRMTKFFNIDLDKNEFKQIQNAIDTWNTGAGF